VKTYYLRLVTADFTKDGNVWTSGIVDLYDNESAECEMVNPSYRNFSTVKSNFGLDLTGNNIFVGLEETATDVTELGQIINSTRFLDESGRIDIVNYVYTLTNAPGTGYIASQLETHTIDDVTAEFPDEWTYRQGPEDVFYIGEIQSYRYAKFVLTLTTPQDLSSADIEMLIRVRIGEPLQGAPLYKSVTDIQNKFPEWMAIREIDNEPATPALGVPTSVGGQVFSATVGEWLDELTTDIAYTYAQQFINTADETQAAWVYTAHNVPNRIYRIEGDGLELSRCVGLRDFYELTTGDDGFWLNSESSMVFTNKEYTTLTINGDTYTQTPHHIWNWFDEFGLRVDLRRHELETNKYFKSRILDVFTNKPGVGLEAFKLAIRRELSLWQYFEATPGDEVDTQLLGATPEVLEIEDLEAHSDFVDSEGVPTQKFIDLIQTLAVDYPASWGNFVWGELTWDTGGEEGDGFSALAHRYDATPLDNADTQSGVGDGNDLYVYRPDEITGPREFTGKVKLRGREKKQRSEYRRIEFDVNIWGEAPYDLYANPDVTQYFTAEVKVLGAATPGGEEQIFYHTFSMTAQSNVNQDSATPTYSADSEYRIMTWAGQAIYGTAWTADDGSPYTVDNDDFYFDWDDIEYLKLHQGTWSYDMGTPSFSNLPASDDHRTYFSNDPDTYLEFGGASSITASDRPSTVVMYSKSESYAGNTWASEKQRYHVSLNGALPDASTQNFTIPLPTIIWHPYLTGAKTYIVELATYEDASSGSRGGFTVDAEGASLFIPASYLNCNGLSDWYVDMATPSETTYEQTYSASTTEFVFSSSEGASPQYPVLDSPYWELFEYEYTNAFSGVVDENGPWRNGIIPQPDNSNYNLLNMTVDRNDFGIPNTEDYVVTWMGVESENNSRVILWLDSNTVEPYFDDGTEVEYPTNAVQETFSSAVYGYGPFIVRARLDPNIAPQWYPQVNSGWFYDRNDEYYFYTNPTEEGSTINTSEWMLDGVARQGAPIIVKSSPAYNATPTPTPTPPEEYRQIANWDEDTNGYTMWIDQTVPGTGYARLYAAYQDIYDIVVTNLSTGVVVAASTFTTSNEIIVGEVTDTEDNFEIRYKVNRSFFADHDVVGDDNAQHTVLYFDQDLSEPVTAVYETSKFDFATPVDLPVNTFYTIADEGFMYISHNEYDLDKVEVVMSPSTLVADGNDYLYINIRSLDVNGNPKPNANLTLSTTFGTMDRTEVTTDDDGYAVVRLTADTSGSDLFGQVFVSGDESATVSYAIHPVQDTLTYRLNAVPNVQEIPADGESQVYLHGKVEDSLYNPVPYAVVYWRKGRYMKDIWMQAYSFDLSTPGSGGVSGRTLADEEGIFNVGPFTAATPFSPGYWMVVLESETSSPNSVPPADALGSTPGGWVDPATPKWGLIGDAVFWVEYPDQQYGVEDLNGLPRALLQMVERVETIPDLAPEGRYKWPTYYDEATPNAASTPVYGELNYEPSKWYAIDQYGQYQLGLLGDNRQPLVESDLAEAHPDYRDI